LFIVLDGKPFLSGSDNNLLDQDLKETIEWLAKNRVEVYALGLDKAAEKYFGNRFFHWFTSKPMSSLPTLIINFIQT
jgi:hypothetical protein